VDGRRIERHHLEQAAAAYDPNVYAARIWLEHLRSFYPDSAFGAYGDVLALKAEEITLAGEKRLALYAQLAPTQALRRYGIGIINHNHIKMRVEQSKIGRAPYAA